MIYLLVACAITVGPINDPKLIPKGSEAIKKPRTTGITALGP